MPQHAERMLADYKWRGRTHLLATKLDEYPGERTIETLAREHDIPIRWVCTGQAVPGDVVAISEQSSSSMATLDDALLRGVSAA
jgi:flagellar biosynthesis GTPase FlhF